MSASISRISSEAWRRILSRMSFASLCASMIALSTCSWAS
ncbi:MAG: hypothetical protein FJ313_05840 [Gemmatimonadetes bacterium]|nr:hypothetical protein [Gemmatimonadota bacterium]